LISHEYLYEDEDDENSEMLVENEYFNQDSAIPRLKCSVNQLESIAEDSQNDDAPSKHYLSCTGGSFNKR
jgi:hypothetical protein